MVNKNGLDGPSAHNKNALDGPSVANKNALDGPSVADKFEVDGPSAFNKFASDDHQVDNLIHWSGINLPRHFNCKNVEDALLREQEMLIRMENGPMRDIDPNLLLCLQSTLSWGLEELINVRDGVVGATVDRLTTVLESTLTRVEVALIAGGSCGMDRETDLKSTIYSRKTLWSGLALWFPKKDISCCR
ncbi:hypothetical protein BJ742DRAFT_740402 [Cladochytrium replicatum]|nr:hypothetical protein BJ742DRAFT_740402 [Cladochytrium replicatum]